MWQQCPTLEVRASPDSDSVIILGLCGFCKSGGHPYLKSPGPWNPEQAQSVVEGLVGGVVPTALSPDAQSHLTETPPSL